jgi:exosortase A-associated hydrolase 1
MISCGEDRLFCLLHRSHPGARRGVVIVVAGGPQYRAGAHRQFVALARRLAAAGTPVLRFDLRGMGDSSGTYLGFEQSKPDIRAAVDALVAAHPGMREVVLMGECESATGILFYAHSDPRVAGAVLVNPWVRTEEGRAAVVLKNYYLGRLLSGEFWKKVRKGEFQIGSSLRSMLEQLVLFRRGRKLARQKHSASSDAEEAALPLPVRTALGMRRFQGQVLLLMSGRDFIAREFDEVVKSSASWQGLLDSPRISRVDMPDADHTFSREVLKVEVAGRITDWLGKW